MIFWAAVIVIFLFVTVGTSVLGIGAARGESTYTGYIVDTEIDKGFVFRPSTAHMKTHVRASTHESFCLPTDQMEQQAMEFQEQEQKIRITYSRPVFVSPTKCDNSVSLVQAMEPVE
jgi:hypothetical protein